ncbi:LysM peptidoglycan-binding domain-containing protein [Candidatus Electrothrix sp.]|uniref:LysM peptidoglycan-binding domain-containing protein n=1 Tax=Candidatus Electrothrix sp. TaxID=2170559 RepID=UPI0040563C1E
MSKLKRRDSCAQNFSLRYSHIEKSLGSELLLLVQAESKEWKKDKPEFKFTCVAGKIDVGKLIDLSADSELSRTISQLGFDKEKDQLHLHASGCSIHGQVSLPWQGPGESVTGSFLLTPLLPNEEGELHCRLRLDQEMLTKEEHDGIGTAWENLSKNFRHDSEFKSDKADKPTWVTLEAKQDLLPDMYWPVSNNDQQDALDVGPLHIAHEAFRLILSDQHPDDPNNSPDTLAYVQPEVVRIEKKEGVVSIVIESGERPTAFDGDKETEVEQHPPILSFVSKKAEKKWKDAFTLSNMNFTFDHVRTARRIRTDQDLPVPRWNPADKPENTEPLESPSITGFMPLEDGWAQVPIPNLTEQIYTDAGLIQPEISLKKSDAMLLQGAVMYGNEEILETKQQGVSSNPFSLLLTNARYIKGEWRLTEEQVDTLALSSVELTIFKPDITLDGFLWLSAGRPTTANALPDFDNWVSGLYSVPLRTVHTGLPFVIPYLIEKVEDDKLIEKFVNNLNEAADDPSNEENIKKLIEFFRDSKLDIIFPEKIKTNEIEVKQVQKSKDRWQINIKLPLSSGADAVRPLYTIVQSSLKLLTVYYSLSYLLFDNSVHLEGLPFIARKIREKKEAENTLLSILDSAAVDEWWSVVNELANKELVDFFQDSEWNIFLPENIQPAEIQVKEISVTDEEENDKSIKRRWQIIIKLTSNSEWQSVPIYTVVMMESELDEEVLCDFTLYHSLGYCLFHEIEGGNDADFYKERFGSNAKERIIELFALNDIDLSKELTGYHPEQQGDVNEFQLIDRANGFTCTIREESGVLKIRKNDAEVFPPLFTFHVDELTLSRKVPGVKENERSYGELGQWSFSYKRSQHVFARMEKENLLAPQAGYSSSLWNPLFWLCHPNLPMIQALPLTQNQTPPNYPSPSRQLVPFEIDLANKEEVFESWSFGADDNGQWPTVYGNFLKPAEIWKEHFDLPLVSLSLPGLLYDPRRGVQRSNEGSDTHPVEKLLVQYRYDLPYTDELNALASLPETPTDSAARQNDDTAEAVEELQPLTTGTYSGYWQQLSQQASLAAVDAVEAMKPNDSSAFYHLIEPYHLPVAFFELNLNSFDSYPGKLFLGDEVVLERETALEGVSGYFLESAGELTFQSSKSDKSFQVTAGSMAAYAGEENKYIQDQRGLRRSATDSAASNLLQIPVTLIERDWQQEGGRIEQKKYRLTSLKKEISLEVHEDNNWHFWFKDLPVNEREFSRIDEKDNKTFLEINHPDGLSREQNYLLGYEWRLGYKKKEDIVPLKLFHLDFYPLVLQQVTLDDDNTGVIEITIKGRLQLPLANQKEFDHLNNLVTVTFTVEENDSIQPVKQIKLTDIKNVGSGEWPLQNEENNASNARLTWTGIFFKEGKLHITGLQLKHSFFDVEWAHELEDISYDSSLEVFSFVEKEGFTVSSKVTARLYELTISLPTEDSKEEPEPIATIAVTVGYTEMYTVQDDDSLSLIAEEFYHDASKWRIIHRANSSRVTDPNHIETGWKLRIPDPDFHAEVVFDLLKEEVVSKGKQLEGFCTLFGKLDLPLTQENVSFTENTLQFQWGKCSSLSPSLQFLPGMNLKPVNPDSSDVPQEYNAPGIAVITFKPIKEGTQDNKPRLQLQTGYIETLLTCTWGEDNFLQEVQKTKERKEADATEEADPSGINVNSLQVFSSSSGNITCGYTAQFSLKKKQKPNEAQWVESFLLNGILEVKNLVSWPQDLGYSDGNKNNLKLPLVTEKIEHLRHTIRVLLNQHELPKNMLSGGTSDSLLFSFGTEKAWQFLAAVEHQLVNIEKPEPANDEWQVSNDQRWTVVQEVRLAHPEKLKKFLEVNSKYTVDPQKGTDTIGAVGHGYVNDSVGDELIKALDDVIKAEQETGHSMLLVEAGAHHWLKQQAVTAAELSTLQFLPNGSQQAVLSSSADYTVSLKKQNETEKTAWELLSIPFLGRMQDKNKDGVPGEDVGAVDDKRDMDLLRIDPIWHIHSKYRNDVKLPSLLSMFTHFVKHDVELELSAFDTLNTRVFQRLDPASLEENWFRLHHPASEKKDISKKSPSSGKSSKEGADSQSEFLNHAMAALHDTPARLSRAAALNQLFDAGRLSYPPSTEQDDRQPSRDSEEKQLTWRQKSILLYPGVIESQDGEHHKYHGWLLAGLQLLESRIERRKRRNDTGKGIAVYPAATLLPGYAENDNPMPVSYAVSPYLKLFFTPLQKEEKSSEKDNSMKPQVVVAEMICLDSMNRLSPVANRVWDLTNPANKAGIEAVNDQSKFWAKELHLRLAPDSPIAFLRFREIHKVNQNSNGSEKHPLLITRYSYAHVADLTLPEKLTKIGQPVRFVVEQLQFRDGQFGGQEMPKVIHDFELAPPQVTGVQPLYIQPEKGFADLPWGYGALCITTQYTREFDCPQGVAGPSMEKMQETDMDSDKQQHDLWWHAPQHLVQFRTSSYNKSEKEQPEEGEHGNRTSPPSAGLPETFRAKAIKSFLPVIAQPVLPQQPLEGAVEKVEGDTSGWQPVLPGELRYLLIGNRAGSMLAFRSQILRQTLGEGLVHDQVLVSGSIPVQHRVPRPVPLPLNQKSKEDKENKEGIALQTWASFFEPTENALVTDTPADEAFFAPCEVHFTITDDTVNALLAAEVISKADGVKLRAIENIKSAEKLIEVIKTQLGASPSRIIRTLALKHALRIYGVGLARRLRMELTSPSSAEIPKNWGGELDFHVQYNDPENNDKKEWKITPSLLVNGKAFFLTKSRAVFRLPEEEREEFPAFELDFLRKEMSLLVNEGKIVLKKVDLEGDDHILFKFKDKRGLAGVGVPEQYHEASFKVQCVPGTENKEWKREVSISGEEIPLDEYSVSFKISDDDQDGLKTQLTLAKPGTLIKAEAIVSPPENKEGFSQTLSFMLRRAGEQRSLPLSPRFIYFEDPEYNRRLASPTARVVENILEDNIAHSVTLSVDRKEYNPDSVVTLRYDWDDERSDGGKDFLTLQRVRGPVAEELTSIKKNAILSETISVHDEIDNGKSVRKIKGEGVAPGKIIQISLTKLMDAQRLDSGDRVQFTLNIKLGGSEKYLQIRLQVNLVAEPVIPPPEAAYALLRCQKNGEKDQVQCVRFAWGPEASRVDLVCPKDLRTEIVRRRAVFQWQDSARQGTVTDYKVQKITENGSTHFPLFISSKG